MKNFTHRDDFLDAGAWKDFDESMDMMPGTYAGGLEEVVDRHHGRMFQRWDNNYVVAGWSVKGTLHINSEENYRPEWGVCAVAQCWEVSNSGENIYVIFGNGSDEPLGEVALYWS